MTPPLPLERLQERSKDNPNGPLFRDFTVQFTRAENASDDAPLTLAISSEAPVLRYDWHRGEMYNEVLDHAPASVDLSYVRDGIPVCLDHYLSKQIGIGEGVRVDADRVMRTDVKPGSHPDASWAFADMRNGVRKKVSVGYDPGDEYVEEKRAGDAIPTRRYLRWMPFEVSTVTVPADYTVGVGRDARGIVTPVDTHPADTEAASSAHTGERTMSAPDTGAGAAAVAAPVSAGPTREQLLANLAKQHNRSADLITWIAEGRSVQDVKDALLDEMTARNAARPDVSTAAPKVDGVRDRAEDKPWGEGEFFRTVIAAERAPENMDVRLRAQRAGTGANVGVNSEGGFAVPPGEVNIMFDSMYKSGALLTRVDRRPITVGNTYSERLIKETSRANSSRFGGILAGWTAENGSITATKPELREVNLTLRKLAAAAYLTEEQIEDGPALQSYISRVVPEEMRFQTENAIWAGTGAGQPLGILNAGSLASVAIEASQTIANTNGNIWVNAAKMFGAMPASLLEGAAWFINQELWAKILTATAGTSGGSHPMFTPPGQLASLPNGGIYGKPIVPIEYASAEGTLGDFVFANFSDYLMIDKGGFKSAVSMHVRFLNDEQVLKFTYRVDGSPRTLTAMTPFKGSQAQSPYIALAARS